MFRGMLSVVLLQHCHLYLLHYIIAEMLISKFTTGFYGEKVPRTPIVFKSKIPFRKKKWNQSSGASLKQIENIPKNSKNAAHVLQCEFFLKAPL